MLPAAGTDGLEGLNDIAKAPLHGLKHLYDAMEMVRHTYARMHDHVIAMS